MNVKVEYSSQLKKVAGGGDECIELVEPCSLRQLVSRLAEKHGGAFRNFFLDEGGEPRPTVLVFVNNEQAHWKEEQQLRDGDQVAFMSAIAGGV